MKMDMSIVKYIKMYKAGEITKAELEKAYILLYGDTPFKEEEPNNNLLCLECDKEFECETDIWLCEDCMKLFDTDRLWRLHDSHTLDALKFNRNGSLREHFRLKSVEPEVLKC